MSGSGPVRSFPDLVTPDRRSLRFTARGLSLAGQLTPESATAHIQHTLGVGLDASVPETTRRTLERVRFVHLYGLFSYELFTAAEDLAVLSLEQAFTDRF